jgi:N-acetyltransferase
LLFHQADHDEGMIPDVKPIDDWLAPVTLTGHFLRLEPLAVSHAAGIFQHADACTAGMLARGGPSEHNLAGWTDYVARLVVLPNRVNWAVVLLGEKHAGAVAGRISYSTVNHADRWLEIGTMLTPPFQGGVCNPEAKMLLLERAFEVLGAGRVQFRVDVLNARSRAAMRKLGATEEGILRRYQQRPDGTARDSVISSVLPEEWPGIKAGLVKRLDAFQHQGEQ